MYALNISILLIFTILLIANCHETYSELEEKVSKLEKSRSELAKAIRDQREKNGQLLKSVKELKNELNHRNNKRASCDGTSGVVAFHTRLTNAITFNSSYQTVIYDYIQTNIGSGYDKSTGYFTAPVTGNYQFIANVMSRNGTSLDIEIIAGGTYCRAHAGSQSQAMGTCVAFVSLGKGNTVYVRRYSNRGTYMAGGKYASFSGHLIST